MTSRAIVPFVAILMLRLCTGCADDVSLQMMTRELPTDDRDAVLTAAQRVLVENFPRLTVDRQAYVISSAPAEYNTTDESGTSRDLVGASSTMRRLARFGVSRRGDRTVARVRVDVERRDTSRREVVSPESYRLSDSPSYSPIDRDAARTRDQNAAWTRVRRDSRLERALLDELERVFAPDVEAPPTPRPRESETAGKPPPGDRPGDTSESKP